MQPRAAATPHSIEHGVQTHLAMSCATITRRHATCTHARARTPLRMTAIAAAASSPAGADPYRFSFHAAARVTISSGGATSRSNLGDAQFWYTLVLTERPRA